jgi:MATE family multidrug resistance protein
MIPMGISIAATVRVGHAVGRGDVAAARRAGFGAITLGAGLAVVITFAIVTLRDLIPTLFLDPNTAQAAETVRLAATLLLVGTSFFVMDAIQGVAAGALRGLNDTRIPLLFAAISFWVIGFSASYGLAFRAGLGAIGVWIGFSLGLATFATLLVWRFHVLTARAFTPKVA